LNTPEKKCFVIFYTVIREKNNSHCTLPKEWTWQWHPYCSRTKFLLLFSLNNKIVNRFSATYCSNSENKASRNPEPNTYLEGDNFPSNFPIKETKKIL
jgi:hypothetical protein